MNKNLKVYYSIKEVSELVGVSQSTLRYWETQFTNLKPKTSSSKARMYTEKDIEEIRLIYNMVKTRGFKIAKARKMIYANRAKAEENTKAIEQLQKIKAQLVELKEAHGKIS